MKNMYELDTNIFLEVLLEQEQAELCTKLLAKIRTGEMTAILLDFSVDGIIMILERYHKTPEDIRRFLLSLLGYSGLRIYPAKMIDKIRATVKMKRYKLDFDDSLILQCAQSNSCAALISLDQDFSKVKDFTCLTPAEVLGKQNSK